MTTMKVITAWNTVKDVSGDPDHDILQPGGAAYGLWVDGNPHPYRDSGGNVYVNAPCSENYRFKVGLWQNGATWAKQGPTFISYRGTAEAKYANRHWIWANYAIGNNVYALAHHEWYQTTTSAGGVGGYNGYSLPNRRWVNSIAWMKSTNGGSSFSLKPADPSGNNKHRQVLLPEPWATQSRDTTYGFYHPSNIVKEGSYYYSFVRYGGLEGGTDLQLSGFCLIRTNDLEKATGWQYWNGSGWTTVSHATYQGNLSTQQPHVFFPQSGFNLYTTHSQSAQMAQCVRRHVASGKWMVFGWTNPYTASTFCWIETTTLASPNFGTNVNKVDMNGFATGADYIGDHYLSVFDPTDTSQNYENISDQYVFVCTINNLTQYRFQQLQIIP